MCIAPTQDGANIRDAEFRLAGLFAEADINASAVILANSAVKRKRNGGPLIFFDTAVIVGFKESHGAVLINRALL